MYRAHITATIAILVVSVFGHTSYAQAPSSTQKDLAKQDSKTFTMMILRDRAVKDSCIDYALIPEGERRVVELGLGQHSSGRADPISNDISSVNIFKLYSNGLSVAVEQWQLPAQPSSKPIIAFVVEIHEELLEAIGTVYYSDGSKIYEKQLLKNSTLSCSGGAPPRNQ